jgi:hypothetical protein
VSGVVVLSPTSSTSITQYQSGVSTAASTVPVAGTTASSIVTCAAQTPGSLISTAFGPTRILLGTTTTMYLNCNQLFSGGTMAAWGQIVARRAR